MSNFYPLGEDFDIHEDTVREHLQRLQPKIFAFTAASNTLGTEFPVARWTELAREVDCHVLVDAAQAVPHRSIDVQAWNADFVVFSGHKMCGPSGIGVLYGKETLLDSMPPFLGGGAMIHRVTTSGFEPAGLPEKFEAGTPPIAEAIGLEAAIEYLKKVGLEKIADHEHQLGQLADSALRRIERVSNHRPHTREEVRYRQLPYRWCSLPRHCSILGFARDRRSRGTSLHDATASCTELNGHDASEFLSLQYDRGSRSIGRSRHRCPEKVCTNRTPPQTSITSQRICLQSRNSGKPIGTIDATPPVQPESTFVKKVLLASFPILLCWFL